MIETSMNPITCESDGIFCAPSDFIDESTMTQHLTLLEFLKKSLANGVSFERLEGALDPLQLFSLKQFQDCLNNPLLSPDWLRVSLGGQVLDLQQDSFLWKTVQHKKLVFLDKQPVHDAIESGAAVVLEGLDILLPAINQLLEALDQLLPCALSNAEAFFSQAGNEAYGGHRDSDDVLVIQISGVKHWHVHRPQQRRYMGNAPLNAAQMGPVMAEFDMKPGDVLYVKAGVPHRCTTPAEHSLHISIDLCDRTPNIEQLTALANQAYNVGSANSHVSANTVVDHYVKILQSPEFRMHLHSSTQTMKLETQKFRQRISQSACVTALEKFY